MLALAVATRAETFDRISDPLAERGIDCDVRRASAREPTYEGELLSTAAIVDRILERHD
jgi:FAD synthetase